MRPAVIYTAEDSKQYTEAEIRKIINQWLDYEFVEITDEERADITEQAYNLILKNPRWYPYITLMQKMKFREE
jgi:disulfide oxidoreductase YuzD